MIRHGRADPRRLEANVGPRLNVIARVMRLPYLPAVSLLLGLLLLNGCSGERFTELMKASRDGNVEAVQRALDRDAEVDYRNSKGKTALMLAAAEGHAPVVALLLDHGAAVNTEDAFGTTALIAAATAGKAEAAELLAQRGADPTHRDSSGGSALNNATFFGHSDTVRVLLPFAKNLPEQDANELMLIASGLGHTAIIQELLKFGVSPNARGMKQRSALMAAAAFNKIDAAKLLLDHGADPTLQDEDGFNAFDVAKDKNHDELFQVISERYAQQNKKDEIATERNTRNP